MPKRILITGTNGFIGRHLTRCLLEAGYSVVGAVRSCESIKEYDLLDDIEFRESGTLSKQTFWDPIVKGVDVVIHLAAAVHMNKFTPSAHYFDVNYEATNNLAASCVTAGVSRMIFLSTIGVMGKSSGAIPFNVMQPIRPMGPYAESKYHAELALQRTAAESGMELAIIRPPLVYGLSRKGNFIRLLSLVNSGVPLPFASLHNKKSLVSVWNLCDLIETCVKRPLNGRQVLLVSDGDDISTPDLISRLGVLLQRPARLIRVPVALLKIIGSVSGQRDAIDKLVDSLQLDIGYTCGLLRWKPPMSLDEGLARTVNAYRETIRP